MTKTKCPAFKLKVKINDKLGEKSASNLVFWCCMIGTRFFISNQVAKGLTLKMV